MGAWTTITVKNASGVDRAMRAWDESGAGTGPFLIAHTVAASDGTAIDPAQDGADATGVTPPAGAVGIRGWLSGIYSVISGAPITGASLPAGGAGLTGWLSAIWTVIGALRSATSLADVSRIPVDERDSLAVSGSATSAAVLFALDMAGYESISVQVVSAGVGCTVSYEASEDNANWVATSGLSSASIGISAAATSSSTALLLQFRRTARHFRARVSTYGSGTVSVVGHAAKAPVANVGSVLANIISAAPVTATGNTAHGAGISGNPVRIGVRAVNAPYAAVANGQNADLVSTLVGALIVKPFSIPENDWSHPAQPNGIVNSTTAETLAVAAGAGLRNYLTAIDVMAEPLTNATELVIRDGAGGTVVWRTKLGVAGQSLTHISFPNPIKSSANSLLEVATLTASGAGAVFVNARGFVAP